MIKAVLFDLDGTLVDSIEDLAFAVNMVLQRHGYPKHEVDNFKFFIGDGIQKLVVRALPQNISEKMQEECFLEFTEYYGAHFADRTRAYSGVEELLQSLKKHGILTAVVSNKSEDMTKSVVKTVFSHNFDFIIGKREDMPAKPDPKMILYACENLGVSPEECIFVGDSGMDMKAAVGAGILPVGVLWGYREAKELKENGAKYLAKERRELLEFILKENRL